MSSSSLAQNIRATSPARLRGFKRLLEHADVKITAALLLCAAFARVLSSVRSLKAFRHDAKHTATLLRT